MTAGFAAGGLYRRPVRGVPEAVLGLVGAGAFAFVTYVHVTDKARDRAQNLARYEDAYRYNESHSLHLLERIAQHLGTVEVLLPLGLAMAVAMFLLDRWARAAVLATVSIVVPVVVGVCKLVMRDPAVALFLGHPIGSFPSGHTADVTAIIGTMLLCLLPIRDRALAYVIAVGGGLAVGGTRVVSGAHTHDDVIAAWLFGSTVLVWAGGWLARHETAHVQQLSPPSAAGAGEPADLREAGSAGDSR